MSRIKGCARWRPHLWVSRFMCRAIWRDPYQGVSKNCLSPLGIILCMTPRGQCMMSMNRRFSALSPFGHSTDWNASTSLRRTADERSAYDPCSPFFASRSKQLVRGIHCPLSCTRGGGAKNPAPPPVDQSWREDCQRQRRSLVQAYHRCA
jgi:hypothetical protein